MAEGRGYGFVGEANVDAFRPPVVPVLYAAVFSLAGPSVPAARLVSAVFLLLAVVAVWLLGKRLFGNAVAGYAAVFVAAAPTLWLYSTKALAEAAVVFLSAAFLYLFYRSQDSRKWLVAAMPMLALLSPWLANNMAVYGNPVGAITTQFANAGQQTPAYYYNFEEAANTLPLTDPFYITVGLPLLVGFFFPFTLLGLYYLYKDKHRKHLAVFLLLALLFILLLSALSEKRDRYLLPLIPVVALATGYGFERLGNIWPLRRSGSSGQAAKAVAVALAVIVVLSLAASFYLVGNYPKHERFEALDEAGAYLNANCIGMPGGIYSNNYPYVFWFTGESGKDIGEAGASTTGACLLVDNYIYTNIT